MSFLLVIKTNQIGKGLCSNWNDSTALIKAIVRNTIIGSMPNGLIPPFSTFAVASLNEMLFHMFCVYFTNFSD